MDILLMGALLPAIGFGLRMLLDYYYLKSPRLVAFIKIENQIARPPQNGFRRYEYTAKLEIHNHSKNDAYGLTVVETILEEPFRLSNKVLIPRKPLNEQEPSTAPLEFFAVLEVNDSNSTASASDRLNSLKPVFKVKVAYQNQLGKKYEKSVNIAIDKTAPFEWSFVVR